MIASWFSPPSVPGAVARWFCFPHAGGGASAFSEWRRALAADRIDVRAVQLPGRERRLREPAIDDMSTLVARLDDALCAFEATHPPLPTLWFGHSSGARVAFELARRRHAAGRPLPGHLVVSGAPAPDIVRTTPTLHRIADDVTFLRAVADAYGGVPADVFAHEELRALVTPTLRADLRLHERYVYVDAPPLPIPLLAVGGESDPAVPDAWLQQWARHTTGGFRCERYPGHHFYLHDPVVRSALLRTLRAIRM